MTFPTVTVILPVLDEMAHIEDTMNDLLAQDFSGDLEIVVADGGSSDGTKEWLLNLEEYEPRVKVINNPLRRQAHGINAAAAIASGEILVRVDGHARYATDYVSKSVQALEELGGAVGGRMNPVGYDRFSEAVAAAMASPLTMGPGRFHHAVDREKVDTVYLGAFRREEFLALGGMRSFPSGSSEDADFYYRWRLSGRSVFIDPSIQSSYAPRNRIGRLWLQYWRYGQGKSEMLWVNGNYPSWRPLAPQALVLGLVLGLLAGLVMSVWWPLLMLAGLWLIVLAIASLSGRGPRLLTLVASGVMHLAYGMGGIWGLLKGKRSIRHFE